MASENEVKKLLAAAISRGGFLDDTSSLGQSPQGLYLRLGDRVFRLDVTAIEQIDNAKDSVEAAANFMKTLPYQFDKDGRHIE